MGHYTQVGICGKDILFPMDQVFFKQLNLTGFRLLHSQTWTE